MKYIYSRPTEEDFIADNLRVDTDAFDESLQGKNSSIRSSYEANMESYILAYSNNEIVGYICFFPIKESLCDKTCNGEKALNDVINDTDIPGYYNKNGEINKEDDITILLFSIAVKNEHKGKGIDSELIKEFFTFISDKIQRGNKIRKMYAYGYSRLLEEAGFSKSKRPEAANPEMIRLMHYIFDDFSQANVFLYVPFFVNSEDKPKENKRDVLCHGYPAERDRMKKKYHDNTEYSEEHANKTSDESDEYDTQFWEEVIVIIESKIAQYSASSDKNPEKDKEYREDLSKAQAFLSKAKAFLSGDSTYLSEAKAFLYLNELYEVTELEFDNELSRQIKRCYLGEYIFTLIDENCTDRGKKWFSLYALSYEDFYIAVLGFDNFGDDPTWILDQASMNDLRVSENEKESEYDFTDFFKKKIAEKMGIEVKGIEKLGETRCMTSLVKKPLEIHLAYMMACERYTETAYVETRLTGSEFYERANVNISQYLLSEVYVSERNVVLIFNPDKKCKERECENKNFDEHLNKCIKSHRFEDNCFGSRVNHDCLMFFVMELLTLQLCAIYSVYYEIIRDFENKDFSEAKVDCVNESFSKAVRLWDCDNFSYLGAKKEYEKISEEFGIPRLREDNKANMDIFEKIVTVKTQRQTEEISRRTGRIILFFTIISGLTASSVLVGLIADFTITDMKTILMWLVLLSILIGIVFVQPVSFLRRIKSLWNKLSGQIHIKKKKKR